MTSARRAAESLRSIIEKAASSTRVRITAAAVIVVAGALAGGGWVINSSLERGAERSVRGTAAPQARWVESLAADAPLPSTLPAIDAARVTLVQVIDRQGRVVASSEQLTRLDDERDGEPGEEDEGDLARLDDGHRGRLHLRGGPWFEESAMATIDGTAYTVVVLTSLADYERALDSVDHVFVVAFPVLVLLVAAATWLLVGRSLRPVERMRREVEAITEGKLDSRVVEPGSIDEIGRLATTLNSMLGRLQASSDRQRRFVADASHELRTPVANIGAALEVAAKYPDRVDWPEVGADIAEQNRRTASLIEDLLLSAQISHTTSPRDVGPVDVADVVRREVAALGEVAPDIVVDDPPPGLLVDADERRLGRLVANLLANAVRHADSRVVVGIDVDGTDLVLSVSDDGPGIPVEERERVFEPFVRLDTHRARSDGGAGLGLAIVRDLVTEIGGSVAIVDRDGGGASFLIRLPLSGR